MKKLNALFDVQRAEHSLLKMTNHCFTEHAKKNPDTEFHSLVFDTNIAYGQVLLSAESTDSFSERMNDWKKNSGFNPILDRWASGDFDYCLFSDDFPKVTNEWEKGMGLEIRRVLENEFEKNSNEAALENLTEECLIMIARVCKKLFHSETIKHIKKTPEFFIMCIDHDESELTAITRQSKVLRSR